MSYTNLTGEKILNAIYTDMWLRQELSFRIPALGGYIESYIADRSCSCKNTILKYLWDNRNSPALVDVYLRLSEYDDTTDSQPESKVSINKREMFGEVAIIPNTRSAYRNLIKRAKNEQWVFHGFTVSEIKRKWKIFFY